MRACNKNHCNIYCGKYFTLSVAIITAKHDNFQFLISSRIMFNNFEIESDKLKVSDWLKDHQRLSYKNLFQLNLLLYAQV